MKAIGRTGCVCLVVWLLFVTAAHAAQPPRYDVKLFNTGGLTDVAAGGKVSGSFVNATGTPQLGIWTPTSGFREVASIRALSDSGVYVTGGFSAPSSVWGADGRLLHQLPSNVVVGAVNSAGSVVGTTYSEISNIWTAAGATSLQAPPNSVALARAINETGQAGGMVDLNGGGGFDGRAAIWNPDGSYTLLELTLPPETVSHAE